MDWTVASTSSDDPAIASMLCGSGVAAGAGYVCCAVREKERLRALHVFAPIDVLVAHRRRRALRLAASFGDDDACGASLPAALRCAADEAAAHDAGCVCALMSADAFASSPQDGFRCEPMRELIFPVAGPRRARTLDLAAAFGELGSAELVRFDYHGLYETARSRAPVLALECNANFIWGVSAVGIFDVLGCELNHPQLFPELLSALRARHRAARVRFLCSVGSMLTRASRVRSRSSGRAFVHNLPGAGSGNRFDAHAGLACSRH